MPPTLGYLLRAMSNALISPRVSGLTKKDRFCGLSDNHSRLFSHEPGFERRCNRTGVGRFMLRVVRCLAAKLACRDCTSRGGQAANNA